MKIILSRRAKEMLMKLLRGLLVALVLGGLGWLVTIAFMYESNTLTMAQALWQAVVAFIVAGMGIGGYLYVERI